MGKRDRIRIDGIKSGGMTTYRNERASAGYLRCHKCRAVVIESGVTQHLMECQPGGSTCGKCGEKFPPAEFLEHFRKCEGENAGNKSQQSR